MRTIHGQTGLNQLQIRNPMPKKKGKGEHPSIPSQIYMIFSSYKHKLYVKTGFKPTHPIQPYQNWDNINSKSVELWIFPWCWLNPRILKVIVTVKSSGCLQICFGSLTIDYICNFCNLTPITPVNQI